MSHRNVKFTIYRIKNYMKENKIIGRLYIKVKDRQLYQCQQQVYMSIKSERSATKD